MDNAHRKNVKNLFRWWNGQVFSFETVPGTNRKDNDGFDSGMDEAEAAFNSDEGFSGEESGGEKLGDDNDGWVEADQRAPQMNSHPDDLSINLMQLSISERSGVAPSNSVAALAHAIIVPRVCEPTLVHSAGVASVFCTTT